MPSRPNGIGARLSSGSERVRFSSSAPPLRGELFAEGFTVPSKNLALAELTPQQLEFASLLATEGYKIKDAAIKVGVSISTGYNWNDLPAVKAEKKRIVDASRERIDAKANQLVDKAFKTLEGAMASPAFTPSQVKAAHIVLLMAKGSDAREASQGTHLTVNMHTDLGAGLVEAQARRHRELSSPPAIEGGFTLVDNNG